MTDTCRVRFSRRDFDRIARHLFPGDYDEHGGVVLAGLSQDGANVTLLVREFHPAQPGSDYVGGQYGYKALTPTFIHKLITRARDQRLVYLAIHNHGSDTTVNFSSIDLESHERGYPALLQISNGMPVGALVFGHRSVQADVWMPGGSRLTLDTAVIIGTTIAHLTPYPRRDDD